MKSFAINVNYDCNNRCKYCPVLKTKTNSTLNEIKESVEEAGRQGFGKIVLGGGEPLISRNIFEIIDYIKQQKMAFDIKTNARMALYPEFAKKIAGQRPEKVIIKFPSYQPDVFEDVTQVKGSYFQTLKGIKNLVSLGLQVEAQILICKENSNHLKETITVLKRIGVNNISLEKPVLRNGNLKYRNEIILSEKDFSNSLKKAKKFLEKAKRAKSEGEIQTYVQVNSGCNQKCVFCNRPPTEDYRKSKATDIKDVARRIDEIAKDWNVKRIIFTGGEPLLYPKLPEIISYTKRYGFKIEIQTNGILLNKKKLKKLKESGLDIVNFACHSHKKEISNKLRGIKSGFEKINENIKLANKEGFEIHMIHVINSLNYKDLPGFIDFVNAMELNDFYLNLSIVVPEGWAWENRWTIPRIRDIKPYLQEAMKKCKELGIKFDVSEIVPLCIMEGFEEYAVSTLFKISKLKIADDYYTGQRFLDFDKPSSKYALKASQCKECNLNDICAGFYPRLKELYGVEDFKPRMDDPAPIFEKLGVGDRIKSIFKGKEIESFSHKKPRAPEIIYINLDERCNQDCVFCVVKGTNKGKFGSMDKKEAKRIIKDFVNCGGKVIVFTGGEPTLRGDLPEIIEYAENFKEINSISIITNGVRLEDKGYLKKILDADKKRKVSFCFSLHSHKEKISELLTKAKGSFKKTISGIENVTKSGRSISIYQVITTKNCKDLLAFCKFLNNKFPQIRDVTFAYPFPQGNALENDWIFPKITSLRLYLLKSLEFLERKGYKVSIAACGQFPLCAIPGFEEKVLESLSFSEENISGVVGEKSFHEFEMASEEWAEQYKNKSSKCQKCVLNKVCQGFWKKYIELFGFEGIKPVTKDNFKGNKTTVSLENKKDFEEIENKLVSNKLNLLSLKDYDKEYLDRLINVVNKDKLLLVVIHRNKTLYP